MEGGQLLKREGGQRLKREGPDTAGEEALDEEGRRPGRASGGKEKRCRQAVRTCLIVKLTAIASLPSSSGLDVNTNTLRQNQQLVTDGGKEGRGGGGEGSVTRLTVCILKQERNTQTL